MTGSPLDDWKNFTCESALPCNSVVLRQLRRNKGWTQTQLAKVAGYSRRLISKAEAGEPISLATIEDLAEALSSECRTIFPADLVLDPVLRVRELILLLQNRRPASMEGLPFWLDEEVELHIVGHRKVKLCPPTSAGRSQVLSVLEFLWAEFGGEPLKLEDVHCVGAGSEVAIWSKLYVEAAQPDSTGDIQTGCLLDFRAGRIARIELMLDAAAWQARLKSHRHRKD